MSTGPTQTDTEAAAGEVGLANRATVPGAAPDESSDLVGRTVGRYRVTGRLGQGGMGVVFAAYDPGLERKVALKVLPPVADDDQRGGLETRLRREAQALARLDHRNVVAVYDVGVAEHSIFVAMQMVDGSTLADHLAAAHPPPRRILELFAAAGQGLAAAHDAGIVHRDFKPSNVLVDRAGRVYVGDFGLARTSDDEPLPAVSPRSSLLDASVTRVGAVLGTPVYMAPEQHRGEPATARSDQFSFCVSLWEALFEAHPYAVGTWSSATVLAAMEADAVREPPRRGVPARVVRALRRGLRHDPAARWPSMAALVDELTPQSRRAWAFSGAGVVVGVVVAGFAAAMLAPGATPPRPPAVAPADAAAPPVDLTPTQLTDLGGCAFSPAFLDEDTIAFDLTIDGTDLYRLDLDGSAPVRLTSDPGWEWRASRGASDHEIVFTQQDETHWGIETYDLTTGARVRLAKENGPSTYARDSYFYAPESGSSIRRRRGEHEEIFLTLPGGQTIDSLAASPDGNRLALIAFGARGAPSLCVVELDHPEPICAAMTPSSGRAAFSSRGDSVYFARGDGIRRFTFADLKITMALPRVDGIGGIAVSPSGRTLVFSRCGVRSHIVDPLDLAAPIVEGDESVGRPVFGPHGELAYVAHVRGRETLVVRDARGTARELFARDDVLLINPAFSPDGDRLVFALGGGSEPGVYLANLRTSTQPNRLTEDVGDSHPVFAGDRIAFTRRGADAVPRAMVVALDGSSETVVSTRPRTTVAGDPAHGRVLLASPDTDFLYWWDPETGREEPGPPTVTDKIDGGIALSPGGVWLLFLSSNAGHLVSRLRVDDSVSGGKPAIEEVKRLPESSGVLEGTIDDQGRALVAVETWSGDLWTALAPAGTPW